MLSGDFKLYLGFGGLFVCCSMRYSTSMVAFWCLCLCLGLYDFIMIFHSFNNCLESFVAFNMSFDLIEYIKFVLICLLPFPFIIRNNELIYVLL